MRLSPTADAALDLIELAGGMFIAAMRHDSRMIGEPEQEAQLFDVDLCAAQQAGAILGVSGLDHRQHQIRRGGLQPIPQKEFVIAWEFLHHQQKPRVEGEDFLRQDLAGCRLLFGWFMRAIRQKRALKNFCDSASPRTDLMAVAIRSKTNHNLTNHKSQL